jgi:hypothetical protein
MVTAIVAMAIMFMVGLATLGFGSGQRQLAVGERVRESSFNMAEAVLNAEAFLLSRAWPGSVSAAYSTDCSSATQATKCPDRATIAAQFTGPEYASASWTAAVQDNGGQVGSYYRSDLAAGQPAYDANGDGVVWIRAQAIVQGAKRTVVAQMKAQTYSIPLPANVITAGHFATTNNGRKVIVDTNGRSYTATPGSPGVIAVRCTSGPKSTCLNYDAAKGQVSPPAYQTGYPTDRQVSDDDLNAMREAARANSTYYSGGCPSSLAGPMVFIENGNCSYTTGGPAATFNSLDAPGMVVIARGTLTLGGNSRYYGFIYAANLQNSTGYVVSTQGTASIIGGVAVEGQGGVLAGSSGTNIAFNRNVFSLAKGYGEPAVVKGTWREVAA